MLEKRKEQLPATSKDIRRLTVPTRSQAERRWPVAARAKSVFIVIGCFSCSKPFHRQLGSEYVLMGNGVFEKPNIHASASQWHLSDPSA
jgi:hypothetical protein